MERIFNHARVIYCQPNDYAAGMYIERVVSLLTQKMIAIDNINDAIEYHQCELTITSYPEFFKNHNLKQLAAKSNEAFGQACAFMNHVLDSSSFYDVFCVCEAQYVSQLFSLLVVSGGYNKVSHNDMRRVLNSIPNTALCLLANRQLAERFNAPIKDFLIENPEFAAELLIRQFGSESHRSIELAAPKSISNAEIDAIMLSYLKQDNPNLNYVRVLLHWPAKSSKLKYSPSKEVMVAAKRKEDSLTKELFSSGIETHRSLGISISPEQRACKSIRLIPDGFEMIYGAEWLLTFTDPGTILNNFIYLFDYIDFVGLLKIPAHKHERSTFLSSIGLHALDEYPSSPAFQHRNNLAIGIMHSYRSLLETAGIIFEDSIEWAFNSYAKSELGIEGFTINLPTNDSSWLDKCKAIGPEIERILISYLLYVEKGEIDPEYLPFTKFKNFSDIPSLITNKYVEEGPDFLTHAGLLFSDQSHLAFSDKHRDAPQQFFQTIIQKTVYRGDYHANVQPFIDHLVDDGTLTIDESGVLSPTTTTCILNRIWNEGAIEICKFDEQAKAEIDSLVKKGWLKYSSSLFTKDESDYLSFMFNNALFSDAIALRNKYDHGAFSVIDPNDEAIELDYMSLLVILTCVTLKVFDELHAALPPNGTVEFVDWPWVDDSVIEVARSVLPLTHNLE